MRKIFHLEIKSENSHKYYWSLSALCSENPNLGISKFSLNRFDFTEPFENATCIIRKSVMKTTLYHGSYREIDTINKNRAMYLTTDIDVAKEYAASLDNSGCNDNQERWIYKIEINIEDAILIEDFQDFDCIGDLNYKDMPEICYNEEAQYFCIKSVEKIELVEMYKNEL